MTGLTDGRGRLENQLPPSGDDVARGLEADVLAGRWSAGSRLPGERALAGQYQVSRPIMREALRRLEERGLLIVVPSRGAYVRALDPTSGQGSMDVFARGGLVTARHLIVARRMLESEAAALAATNHNAEDSTRMTEVLIAFDATPEADPGKGARLDVAFHESIALASANPVIQIMFGSIRVLTHGLVLRSLTDRYVRNEAAPLHRVILDAILARDVPAARASMEEHLVIAERHYGGDLDRPLTETLEQRAATLPRLADLLHEASLDIKARDEVGG